MPKILIPILIVIIILAHPSQIHAKEAGPIDKIKYQINTNIVKIKSYIRNVREYSSIADFKSTISYSLVSIKEIIIDRDPTSISNIQINNLDNNSILVKWDTNHLSTSKVKYRIKGQDIKNQEYTDRTHKHEVIIDNLEPNTTSQLEIVSQGKNLVSETNIKISTGE